MNQPKRGNKGRGGIGTAYNRGKPRGFNVGNTHNQNFHDDQAKASNGDVYQNKILIHAITQLIGCQVTIETSNGCIYDGILKTMSPKGDLILEMAHKSGKRNDHNKIEDFVQVPSRNELIETLVLGAKQVVYMSVANVDLDEVKKDNFTDQAISSRSLNGQLGNDRQLQKWEDPSIEPDESLSLDEHNVNGLDPNEMFAANEKLGVGSSFDHDMKSYTTPVQGSKELEDKAARLAREIEEGNNYRDRSEGDSGKTEEELFSAVVRTPSSLERQQISKGKPQQSSPVRDDNKQEIPADSLERSSPKPQRLQQREQEPKVHDGIVKPVAVIPVEQVKTAKDATASDDQVNQPAAKKNQPQVVGGEHPGIVNIKSASPGNGAAKPKPAVVGELLEFHENFKLEVSKDDQKKKDQSTNKDQNPINTEQEHKESSKEQKPVESTLKTDDKPKFKLNPDAKEFKPSFQPRNTKTPPVQQPAYVPAYGPSPTQNMHRPFAPMVRAGGPMKPRSPFPAGQRYMRPDDGHGGSPISATAAAGSPIIAPGPFPQYIAIQSPHTHQQFQPNMVHPIQHQGYNIVHPGAQGQQHYLSTQTVGIPSSQAGGQSYQENTVSMYVPTSVQMGPGGAYHPGSPQPSPTTGGQFQLQYFHSPAMIQQQQGNQPMQQTVMGHPGAPQPVFVLPQHAGQQPVGMAGMHAPGNPMINAFVPVSDYSLWVPNSNPVEEKKTGKQEEDSLEQENSVASQSGYSEDESNS